MAEEEAEPEGCASGTGAGRVIFEHQLQVALTLRQAPSTLTSLSQSNLLLSSTSWMRAR